MSELFIIVIFIMIFWTLIEFTYYYLWHKIINRIINISLLLSLFIVPDSIACVLFLILILRLIAWLFGPAQDELDEYYYSRFRKAKKKYNRRRYKWNGKF
jgi:hypothetical protein